MRIPAVMAVGGTMIALALLIDARWQAALSSEVVTGLVAIFYYVLAGRDTDLGAMVGSRLDERQASIGMQAAAFSGTVTSVAAFVGGVIALALGKAAWPFLGICVVSGVSFLAGQFRYRSDRGDEV
jgi:hypothetical protein